MSNIDKRALREAAEKATSGKWERGDGSGNGGELLVYCDDALGSAVCEMTSKYNAIPKYQRINNLNFIAAANPATVLALLDGLEATEKWCAALAAENAGLKSIQVWAVADVFKSGAKRFESTKTAGFETDDCLHDAVLVMLSELKTPATDAFLAEVRAQGVEMFADNLLCPDLDDTLREFADELRKGGA